MNRVFISNLGTGKDKREMRINKKSILEVTFGSRTTNASDALRRNKYTKNKNRGQDSHVSECRGKGKDRDSRK